MLNPYRIFESGARKQTGENLKVVWAKFFNSKLGSFAILQREWDIASSNFYRGKLCLDLVRLVCPWPTTYNLLTLHVSYLHG